MSNYKDQLTPKFEKGERIYIATTKGVHCRYVDGIQVRDTMQDRGVKYEVLPLPGYAPILISGEYCHATETEARGARRRCSEIVFLEAIMQGFIKRELS